ATVTLLVADVFPWPYWWPILYHSLGAPHLLANAGDPTALIWPARTHGFSKPKYMPLPHIIYFLIWRDKDSKTHVRGDTCQNQGTTSKTPTSCGCPRRLAFKTVDSYVGQLRAILRAHLETTTLTTTGDPVPNPAAHPAVKRYLKGVTEEQ
ncbi:unnamed protein product, partial [Porites evermanni]